MKINMKNERSGLIASTSMVSASSENDRGDIDDGPKMSFYEGYFAPKRFRTRVLVGAKNGDSNVDDDFEEEGRDDDAKEGGTFRPAMDLAAPLFGDVDGRFDLADDNDVLDLPLDSDDDNDVLDLADDNDVLDLADENDVVDLASAPKAPMPQESDSTPQRSPSNQGDSGSVLAKSVLANEDSIDGACLSEVEANALRTYTTEEYRVVNLFLRSGGVEAPPETQETVEGTMAALKKLAPHKGLVYRGAGDDVQEYFDLSVGKTFCDLAFLSTSTSKNVAYQFAMDNSFCAENAVIFCIKSREQGRNIRHYAVDKEEDEVLFPPSTQFLITEVVEEHEEDGCTVVWMEEVVDSSASSFGTEFDTDA